MERVLKREKEAYQDVPAEHKKALDKRLKSYKNNPDDVSDWKEVKNDW